MGKANIWKLYRSLSSEDQRTFDRWLKANAILGLMFASLFAVMALAGWMAAGPSETTVADSRPPGNAVEVIPVVGFE